MNSIHPTTILLCAVLATACSSLPERPGSTDQGTGGYAISRNQACLIEAEKAFGFGKYAEVEQALARWQGPMEASEPLELLGQAAFATKKFGLAAELFVRAQQFDPENPALIDRTARAQEIAGQLEAASASYFQALALQPDLAAAAVGLLRCHIALADVEGGLRYAREFEQEFGHNAEYLTLAADLAFATSAFETCIQWTRAAQRLGAVHPGGDERLILALAWTDQHDAAIEAATAISSKDWVPEVHRAVGRAGLAVGRGAYAVQHFQFYLADRPDDETAWLDLARAQFQSGNPEKALSATDRALARDGSSASAHLLRAHCLLRLGQDEEATRSYSASLALGADPDEIQPFLDLLLMQPRNSLQVQPATSAKEMAVSNND